MDFAPSQLTGAMRKGVEMLCSLVALGSFQRCLLVHRQKNEAVPALFLVQMWLCEYIEAGALEPNHVV